GLDAELKTTLLYEKAWCLRGEKKNAEAIKVYDEIAKSKTIGALRDRAIVEGAELLADAGQLDRAAQLLGPFVTQSSKNTDAALTEQASYRLAVCLVNQKKHAEAGAVLERFIREHPDSAMIESASLLYGEASFTAGNNEKAVKPLHRATESKDKKLAAPAL